MINTITQIFISDEGICNVNKLNVMRATEKQIILKEDDLGHRKTINTKVLNIVKPCYNGFYILCYNNDTHKAYNDLFCFFNDKIDKAEYDMARFTAMRDAIPKQ